MGAVSNKYSDKCVGYFSSGLFLIFLSFCKLLRKSEKCQKTVLYDGMLGLPRPSPSAQVALLSAKEHCLHLLGTSVLTFYVIIDVDILLICFLNYLTLN